MSICPICGAEVAPRSTNKAFPFCNARCKSIDLGKWLNEDYRIPDTSYDADEAGEDVDDDVSSPGLASDPDLPSKSDMRH